MPEVTLAEILELDDLGADAWRAHTPPQSGRGDIYGGQVAGQSLRAALRTVDPEYLCNSAHCLFLRRGNPTLPLDLHVEAIRTGRTYATRQVNAVQDGKAIFTMLASFHTEEPGREREHPMTAGVPGPDGLAETPRPDGAPGFTRPFEVRLVDVEGPVVRWWGRVPEPFPPDPALSQCALLYMSDMHAGGAAMAAVGYHPGPLGPGRELPAGGNFGSLDHSIWFHRVPVVDEWLLVEVHPLTIRDSRGLVHGTMHDRSGRHLASFTQEVFLKVPTG